MAIILSLNAGSSSLSYGLFDYRGHECLQLLGGKIERINQSEIKSHAEALGTVFEITHKYSKENNISIQAVGGRVVHGGSKFYQPLVVDLNILDAIRKFIPLAPLHNAIDVTILEESLRNLPDRPTIAVFDTGFHHSLPKRSSTYALPKEFSEEHNLRRYGFHGIAHQFVSEELLKCIGKPAIGSRLITCHLGNGASLCAIKDGKSIDTSMGLTPSEGLIMGTRSGDLDPGLILYLINECKFSTVEIEKLINKKSGLLGLSKVSADVRDLEKSASEGDLNATFALEAFVYRISKYIGAYFVALGGLDAIAFSGGIGENSYTIRAKVCEAIKCLGVELDMEANIKVKGNKCITTKVSQVDGWVIHADENLQIARHVYELIKIR